ncbi:PAS domain S-box protein [Bacillus sp. T33-2]|uniref:PAS domain S-box protein n=1 Tax=Bacillus sp. T33-2 TaxID=2054168 RepID=UPI000C777623|nr:PAS domain S-box protein [Bacillus sp. T33-2]PLR98406.1 hypothetical protein CVD19_04800 [Bacillus sp. T33-2]
MNTSSDVFSFKYDDSPTPIIVFNKNSEVTYANDLACTVLGCSKEFILSGLISDLIYHEDISLFNESLGKILVKQGLSTLEIRAGRREKPIWLKMNARYTKVHNEGSVVFSFEDITRQKQTHSLLEIKKTVLKMIVKRESLADILEEISVKMEEYFGIKTYCSILFLGKDKRRIDTVIAPNLPKAYYDFAMNLEIGPEVGSCGTAMFKGETVITPDIANNPLWTNFREFPLECGLRSCWSVPIFLDEEVVGSFAVYHPFPASPSENEVKMVERCADLVGLAVERDQVEERMIQEHERRFRIFIDALPDIVILKDEEGRWLEVNQAAIDKLSLQNTYRSGLNTKDFLELYPNARNHLINTEISHIEDVQTESPVRFESILPMVDGKELALDLMKVPLTHEQDLPKRICVIGRDITENKRAERLLKVSQQKYKSLFQQSPNAIFTMDLEGNLLDINGPFEKILGYSIEALGQSFIPVVDLDYRDITKNHFLQAVEGSPQTYETVAIHKNGEKIYLDIKNVPIVVDGEVVGVYGIADDISCRKKAVEELRQTKELMESLFHHSGDCILIVHFDGTIQNINPAVKTMFGFEPEEAIGKKVQQFLPDEIKADFEQVIEHIQEGTNVIRAENILRKKCGEAVEVSATFSSLRDNQGKLIGLTIFTSDISERKKTYELLRRSDKLSVIGQLAAAVAHEIRNPLTSIKGFIQLFQNRIKKEYIDLMLSELQRVDGIVTEFLSLAKPQVNAFNDHDIETIISKTLSILESQAIYNKIDILSSVEHAIPAIFCDEHKIKQVLINILKNAIEAMPDGGKIEISTKIHDDSHVLIEIKDEGCGIPEEKIPLLGEPFYSSKEKGTGLGLMVCFKIIEEHNGKIEIESELGAGTTFSIFLPLAYKSQRVGEMETNPTGHANLLCR